VTEAPVFFKERGMSIMKVVAIDVETADWNYPCEIGVAEIIEGNVVDSKSWLIKPSCYPRMNPDHYAIHGISNHQLENAPSFKDVWIDLRTYIEGSLLIAHNAQFDIDCISSEMKRWMIKCKPLRYCCTCHQARKHLNLPNYKLETVCKHLGIDIKGHHRAKHDAISAGQVYFALPKTGVKIMTKNV